MASKYNPRKATWLAVYWVELGEAIEHRKAALEAPKGPVRAHHAGHHRAIMAGLKGARVALRQAGVTLP